MDTFRWMSFNVWILFVHLHHSSNTASISYECLVDADCSESSFCDQTRFSCEICVPCPSLLNRASGIEKCAKSEEDCGRCLSGYQSEDLTGQRRSYKCFAVLNEETKFSSNSSSLMTWNEFITLAATLTVLAAMLVVFTAYCVKSRRSMMREHFTDGNRKRIRTDNLPPPYNEVLSSDQTYTFAAPEPSENLNQATPIGRYHMMHREDDVILDELELGEDLHSEGESILGSTETIPSSWEPNGTTNNLDDLAVLSQQNPRIVRSQSSTTLNVLRESPSRSCPNLSSSISTGVYRQRHIFLSSFRRPITITGPVTKQQVERHQLNDPLLHRPLSLDETVQPLEISTPNSRLLQSLSVPEDTTVAQASESTDPADAILPFSRRRARADENPVNPKRRHME